MDGNSKIHPCFDIKTGDYILFGEYNACDVCLFP